MIMLNIEQVMHMCISVWIKLLGKSCAKNTVEIYIYTDVFIFVVIVNLIFCTGI